MCSFQASRERGGGADALAVCDSNLRFKPVFDLALVPQRAPRPRTSVIRKPLYVYTPKPCVSVQLYSSTQDILFRTHHMDITAEVDAPVAPNTLDSLLDPMMVSSARPPRQSSPFHIHPLQSFVDWLAAAIVFVFCGHAHVAQHALGVLAVLIIAATSSFIVITNPHLAPAVSIGVLCLVLMLLHTIRRRVQARVV